MTGIDGSVLSGPNYSVGLPTGFVVVAGDQFSGRYVMMPPGSSPIDAEALVQIRAVAPFELPSLLQNLYAFDNPWVAMMNSANFGIASVTETTPVRQVNLAQGLTHIREFGGLMPTGFPVRVMDLVIQSPTAAVEVSIMVNLYRWAEFMGPCLQVVARIQLAGARPAPPVSAASVRAVVDETRPDQVEYQLVQSGIASAIASLPTEVRGQAVVHIDQLIVTRDISGAQVAIGDHTIQRETEMSTKDDHSVRVGGNVAGTGIAMGQGAQAQVTLGPEKQDEILKLLEQLHADIQAAAIPDSAKRVLARSVPEMQQSVQSANPQSGLTSGLAKINDQLEATGAAAGNLSRIVQTVAQIAGVAGIGIKAVAPFLAALL